MPLSTCTITGTAYYADGTLGDENIYITADQVTLNGSVIGTAAQTFYAAAVGGIITLILPRGSTARLYGNVRGFHDAIVVAIPDTATADLEDLIPVQYSGSLPQGLGTGSSPAFLALTLNGDPTTSIQVKYLAANFPSTTDVLANVTGLSVDVDAGGVYSFSAVLHLANSSTSSYKFAMGGTATATAIRGNVTFIDNDGIQDVKGGRFIALASAIQSISNDCDFVTIDGAIVVNAAGTLTVQAALDFAPEIGTADILALSSFEVKRAA